MLLLLVVKIAGMTNEMFNPLMMLVKHFISSGASLLVQAIDDVDNDDGDRAKVKQQSSCELITLKSEVDGDDGCVVNDDIIHGEDDGGMMMMMMMMVTSSRTLLVTTRVKATALALEALLVRLRH